MDECVARIKAEAEAAVLTPAEYANQFNRATHKSTALEQLPTDAIEWAVKFEALGHPGKLD